MDTNIVRGCLIFGCGALVGALVTNKMLSKKYTTLYEQEVDELREYYKNKNKQVGREVTDEDRVVAASKVISKPIFERAGETMRKTSYISEDAVFTPDQSPEDDEPEEDEEEYMEYESTSKEYAEYDRNKKPYVIPLDAFTDEMIGYDKITLGYYEEDDVLVDDNEDMIDDIEYVIGYASLDRFGDGSEDEDIVYVRNERVGSDYEVVRYHKSYQTEVLGFIDPPTNIRRR